MQVYFLGAKQKLPIQFNDFRIFFSLKLQCRAGNLHIHLRRESWLSELDEGFIEVQNRRTLHTVLPHLHYDFFKSLSSTIIFIIIQRIWQWTQNSVNLSNISQLSSLRNILDYWFASGLLNSLLCILQVIVSFLSPQEKIVYRSFHKFNAPQFLHFTFM